MLHLGEGEGEAEAADSPDAPPSPAALTYLLQGPCISGLESVLPPPPALETSPASLAAPVSAALHPHWSRLGGFRSWSAITLAEKLYKFNMFWKKESSETSYYGKGGK